MRSVQRVLTLLPLLLFAACDHNGGPSAPDASVPVTAATFCHDFSTRVCAGLSSCGCRFDVRGYDAAGCVDARAAECVTGLGARIAPDIQAGRARFDEVAVAACLAASEAMAQSCLLGTGLAAPLPEECAAIVLSTASLGGTCQLTGGGLAFCAAGAGICVPGDAGGDTCIARPGAGVPCVAGVCATGLLCDAEMCAPPRAEGAACTSLLACEPGQICDRTHRCGAPAAANAPCDDTRQCQAGLACSEGTCTALAALGDDCSGPGTCGAQRSCGRAPETRTCTDPDGAGAACTSDTCADRFACAQTSMTCQALPGDGQACLDGACADGFTCIDGQGTCAPLPALGQPCAVGNRFCADGLGCRQSDNTCQMPAGLDQPCLINPPDYLCAAGLGCDFGASGSTCVPLGAAGAACTNDRTCAEGTYCELSTSTCATRLADGAACNDGNECEVGHECELLPGGPKCAPLPGRAQPCFSDCSASLVCKGPGGQCVAELCTIP